MLASLIIFLLAFASNIVALIDIDTTLTLSNKTKIKPYSNFVLVINKDKLKLYKDKLKFKWEILNQENQFHDLKIEFDTIYTLDKNNQLYKIALKSGVKEKINLNDSIKHYEVNYPYMWINTTKNDLSVYDLNKQTILWKKERSCKKLFFLANNELIGCMTRKNIKFYNTLSGKLYFQTQKINSQWNFDSKDSNGGYFSNKKTLVYFDANNKKITKFDINKYAIKAAIRQKERIILNKDENRLSCINVVTNKVRWQYDYQDNIEIIMIDKDNILIKDNGRYKLLDHYSGEILGEFSVDKEEFDIKAMYPFNNEIYFVANNKTYLLKRKLTNE
tara:strand:+ start:457 stop:1452 length:996 start_codon:yes stop_codon:yes gene_type:complete